MNNEKNRVLGRVLAVEETRYVSGARQPPNIGIGTNPSDDTTDPIGDSNTCADTALCNGTTDIAPDPTPTDVLLDCATSNTRRDICIYPAD